MAVQISTRTNFTSVMGTNTHMRLKNGVNMTLKMSVYRQGISKVLKNARRTFAYGLEFFVIKRRLNIIKRVL